MPCLRFVRRSQPQCELGLVPPRQMVRHAGSRTATRTREVLVMTLPKRIILADVAETVIVAPSTTVRAARTIRLQLPGNQRISSLVEPGGDMPNIGPVSDAAAIAQSSVAVRPVLVLDLLATIHVCRQITERGRISEDWCVPKCNRCNNKDHFGGSLRIGLLPGLR